MRDHDEQARREPSVASWPEVGLTIFEDPRGLRIEQRADAYIALGWRLTRQVREFIDAAVRAGLSAVIRSEHPQPNRRERGVKYIGVSRTPHERWVAVLDQYSPATGLRGGGVRRFTVEQAYRAILESRGIPYAQETGGGRNLYVEFDRHPDVFAAAVASVDVVESGLGARHWNQVKEEIGFVTEAVLETALLSAWSTISEFNDLELIGNQVDRVDIVARHRPSRALVLVELKRGIAGREVVSQLDRYVQSHAREHRGHGPVWGAVVAREFTKDVIDAIGASSFPIALFEFAGSPGSLRIVQFASTWPMTGHPVSD